eukprot:7118239-Prymnesium_polylepis.1
MLLLPDSEVHGSFTTAMIAEMVSEEWLRKWNLEKKLAQWASDWGVDELKAPTVPTVAEICDALFKQPPLEWSQITPFQDRTMVLTCRRLLRKAGRRDIYLQGASIFKLPRWHFAVRVSCSPHNPGARELAEELNGIWPGLLQIVDVQSWSNLSSCDHMLVYLNAVTWTFVPELLAAELREAMRLGLHLLVCHEFPSVDRHWERTASTRVQADYGRDSGRPEKLADKHVQPDFYRAQRGRAARAGAGQPGSKAGGASASAAGRSRLRQPTYELFVHSLAP